MPTTVRPRGPLPARVYWTRRLIVFVLPVLLVVVLARVLGGSADGKDEARATQAGASTMTTAAGGADVPITINLRTVVTEACTWQASPETMTVSITSGSDYIWSSRECPASIPPQDVVIHQDVDAPVVVTWSAKRSDESCTKWTDWAMPGFYHVEASALGGAGTDVQFELTGGVPAVVTTTADPQPQGGKNKDKNGDTSHTPGEDGAGNSAG